MTSKATCRALQQLDDLGDVTDQTRARVVIRHDHRQLDRPPGLHGLNAPTPGDGL